MLGTIRTTLVLFSLPLFVSQEVEDDSRVISVALVDDKFEVLSGGRCNSTCFKTQLKFNIF